MAVGGRRSDADYFCVWVIAAALIGSIVVSVDGPMMLEPAGLSKAAGAVGSFLLGYNGLALLWARCRRRRLAFVNYPRKDEEARAMALRLHDAFRPGQVFVDDPSIAPGERWTDEIIRNLDRATVFISFFREGESKEGIRAATRSTDAPMFWYYFEIGYRHRRADRGIVTIARSPETAQESDLRKHRQVLSFENFDRLIPELESRWGLTRR